MKNIVSCYVEENGKAVSVGIAPPPPYCNNRNQYV